MPIVLTVPLMTTFPLTDPALVLARPMLLSPSMVIEPEWARVPMIGDSTEMPRLELPDRVMVPEFVIDPVKAPGPLSRMP